MKDLAAHILDIAHNAVSANATEVNLSIRETDALIHILISDNGCGMSAETLQRVADPFFTSRNTRKVGLGIPLLLQNARQTGGDVSITSHPGRGTSVSAFFVPSHIDCPPWGDLPASIALLFTGHPKVHWGYHHHKDDLSFTLHSNDICQMLNDIPLSHPRVVKWLCEMIGENLHQMNAAQ